MLDLSKEERELLNRVGKKGRIFRQADTFVLKRQKEPNLNYALNPEVCKSLIDNKALKQVQENDEGWIYMAEAILFAPNYIVDHEDN